MNIAFLSVFQPYGGGISLGNTELFKILLEAHDVSLYNFSLLYPEILFPGIENKLLSNNHIENTFVEENFSRRVLNTANPASYYSTASVIRDLSPDVLITRSWMPYVAFSLGSVSKLLETASPNNYIKNIILDKFGKNKTFTDKIYRIGIIDSFSTELQQIRQEKNNKLYVNNHDAFITFSKSATKELIAIRPDALYTELPLPTFNNNKNFNINKKTALEVLNIPEDKKVLLYIDEVLEYKKATILFDIISKLDESYYLLLVGTSIAGYSHYQKIINNLGIKNKIGLYMREINKNEVPIYYSAADAIIASLDVFTSHDNILNILSYDLPVIAPIELSEIASIVKEYELGIVVQNYSDIGQTSTEINNYFNSTSRTSFISNKKIYSDVASWNNVAKELYILIDALMKDKNKSIFI